LTDKKRINKFKAFIITMNFIVWTIIFTAATYFSKAQPEKLTVLDVRYAKSIRETWVMEYVTISLWLFVLAAILSLIGLIINLAFIGDKKHPMSKGLILSLVVSLGAASLYIINLL